MTNKLHFGILNAEDVERAFFEISIWRILCEIYDVFDAGENYSTPRSEFMSKVITYANSKHLCYCQIKLDSGERILISIASAPKPSVQLKKLCFLGLLPIKTIWEYNPTMAGGYEAYVRKMIQMFQYPSAIEPKHPLDVIRDRLLPCRSISEVLDFLFEAECNVSR